MKAFPLNSIDEKNFYTNQGMDLRDYFAAKAMEAALIKQECNEYSIQQICKGSYKIAYEMIKARDDSTGE